MLLRTSAATRALDLGYCAWIAGDLGRAETELRTALSLRPGLFGAGYHLARVLSEQGRTEEAAAALDAAMAVEPPDGAGAVFRALILHDGPDPEAARQAAARIPSSNATGRALVSLMDLRERLGRGEASPGEPITPALPPAARWLPDVAGRALAVLEAAFWRLSPRDAIALHHEYFAGSAPPPESEAPKDLEGRSRPASRKEWAVRLEEAFRRSRFEVVEELCRQRDLPKGWVGPEEEIYRAFSLLALEREARALEILGDAKVGGGTASSSLRPEAHFVRGLCHARAGDVGSAGWAFTRAARSMDILCDEILQRVSRSLNVAWRYEGP